MTYDSTPDTLEHIGNVQRLLASVAANIDHRADVHDASKLESPEKEMFDEYTPILRGLTYGSPEYEATRLKMGPALDHHYANNSHHPEHYEYLECNTCFAQYPKDYFERCTKCQSGSFTLRPNISGMSLLDVIEMLCDWYAAGKRHADGDFLKSLETNRERFDIDSQLYQILLNTAKELKWIE